MVLVTSLVNSIGYNRQESPHLLYGDHSSMQLSSVEMADALCSFIRCRHGNKSIAPSSGTAGVGHHFGPDNLPILVEKVLQIRRSSCGGQSTDPQVPARAAAGATCCRRERVRLRLQAR